MKFRLTTVWDKDAKTILKRYPTIKDFNIEVTNDKLYVILDNLQDLVKLSSIYGELIIIDGNRYYVEEDTIEIYDDYRE